MGRSGVELELYNKFVELLQKHSVPKYAIDELDWLVFVKYGDRFWALSESEQMEVRVYMEVLRKIHGR